MLTCLPDSLCNWDYCVLGSAAGPAALRFDFLTEQGGLSLGAQEFAIRKHGPLSGRWTLEQAGRVVIEAQKPNALVRSFSLRGEDGDLTAGTGLSPQVKQPAYRPISP